MNITRNRLRRLILQEMKSTEEDDDIAWIFSGDHSKEREPARDEKVIYGMLDVGDLFTFEGSQYMMTDSTGPEGPAVNLWTGEMTKMFRDETVILHPKTALKRG